LLENEDYLLKVKNMLDAIEKVMKSTDNEKDGV